MDKETEELIEAELYMAKLDQHLKDREVFKNSPLGQAMEVQREDQNDRLERIEMLLAEINGHLATASNYQKGILTVLSVLAGAAIPMWIKVFGLW